MTSFKDNSTEEKWLKIKRHLKLVDHPVPQSWVLWLMGLHSADQARIAQLEGVVKWYGEQARLARLIHSEGDEGRHAIHMDGGSRSRAALKANEVKK
jgi:hypothetical protein